MTNSISQEKVLLAALAMISATLMMRLIILEIKWKFSQAFCKNFFFGRLRDLWPQKVAKIINETFFVSSNFLDPIIFPFQARFEETILYCLFFVQLIYFLFTFFGGDYERIFVTLEDLIYHWFSSKASINGRIFPLPPPSLEWQILMLPWIWQEENILNYSSHVKYTFSSANPGWESWIETHAILH